MGETRVDLVASSTKRRGRGIGFAGVGIKLGLLACDEVITETRRGRHHLATSWQLANRTRAPWSWIEPPYVLERDGTAVLLKVSNPMSLLLDAGFLEATVLRHFQPLFEPEFIEILATSYPAGLSIEINDRVVVGPIRPAQRYPIGVRVGRQRKPSGLGYLAHHDEPLPEPERGLAISTLGKVIRRGWDWLGITPADADRIEGLIEVPALAEALTLNKGDFLRHGMRGALFLSYRKAIQEAVAAQLESWGAPAPPQKRAPRTRPMERDIRRVLGDLAGDYPMLATLVEKTAGGQRRLPFGEPDIAGRPGTLSNAPVHASGDTESDASADAEVRPTRKQPGDVVAPAKPESSHAPSDADVEPDTLSGTVRLPGRTRSKKPATLSLQIRFETLPDELTLARLIESTVWVNEAHPAWRRAITSRAESYHIALSVAAALAPLAVEAHETQRFVSAFLARWGTAADNGGAGRH